MLQPSELALKPSACPQGLYSHDIVIFPMVSSLLERMLKSPSALKPGPFSTIHYVQANLEAWVL